MSNVVWLIAAFVIAGAAIALFTFLVTVRSLTKRGAKSKVPW